MTMRGTAMQTANEGRWFNVIAKIYEREMIRHRNPGTHPVFIDRAGEPYTLPELLEHRPLAWGGYQFCEHTLTGSIYRYDRSGWTLILDRGTADEVAVLLETG